VDALRQSGQELYLPWAFIARAAFRRAMASFMTQRTTSMRRLKSLIAVMRLHPMVSLSNHDGDEVPHPSTALRISDAI
jgi:hypothetical protein